MKKMQCEVCGGNTVKKIDDSIFECQSCGVHYNKEEVKKLLVEVTGTVKIDHSEEVDNTIKRAEQFYNKGDTEKAAEYYNKALDLDPDNKEATEKINEIDSAESGECYILEQNISADDGVKKFLASLKNIQDIVPDIYKEVDILSTTEAYYQISLVNGEYCGTYSGTACYRHKIPYTEWVDKNVKVGDRWVTRKEPVTKYRTEIERQPRNGVFTKTVSEYYVLSDGLYHSLDLTKRVPFTINNSKHEYIINRDYNEGIFSKLEYYFATNGSSLVKKFIKIPNSFEKSSDGKLSYKGMLIDDSDTVKTSSRSNQKYKNSVKEACENLVENLIQGDYTENVHFDYKTENTSEFYLLVPLQIIKYTYKGKTYISVSILNDTADATSMTFPMYQSNDVAQKESEITNLTSQKNEVTPWVAGAVLTGIGTLFFSIFGGFLFGLALFLLVFCIIMALAVAIKNAGLNSKINELQIARNNELASINSLHNDILKATYIAFFEKYDGVASMETARNAAKKANNYATRVDGVVGYGLEFSKLNTKTFVPNQTLKNASAQTRPNNNNISLRLIETTSDKIKIISILRQHLEIGLAEAKAYADNVSNEVYGFSDLYKAIKLKNELLSAGADAQVVYKGGPCIIYWGNDVEEVPLSEISQVEFYFEKLAKTRDQSEDLLMLINDNGDVIEAEISDSVESYVHYNNKIVRDLSDDKVLFLLKAFFERKVLTTFSQFNWEDFDDASISIQ